LTVREASLIAAIDALTSEKDPRQRMALARRTLGQGAEVARCADAVSEQEIALAIRLLQHGYRLSRGTWNGNRWITLLAQARLRKLGLEEAPIIARTGLKTVRVEAGCLAASSGPLPEGWFEPGPKTVDRMNTGAFVLVHLGYDGAPSVEIRLVDAPEPVLLAKEYKQVADATSIFALEIGEDGVLFGAPETLGKGVRLIWQPGRYAAQIVRLRGARRYRYCLVLCSDLSAVVPLEQVPDLREL
jgi:hypothetical protein